MPFRVIVASVAERDLAAIGDYIAQRSGAQAANAIEEKLLDSIESLHQHSERGRIVPELARQGVQVYREILNGPWRIMYRILGKTVRVVAIIDGRRDANDLLWERSRRKP